MMREESKNNIVSQSKEKSHSLCFPFLNPTSHPKIKKRQHMILIGILFVTAIAICSSIYLVKFSHEYVCGGQKLTDNQYKDLMGQIAVFDGAIPEADFVECKTFVNAKIFRIQYLNQSRVIIYSTTADSSFAKFDGAIWNLNGGAIAEIIHAELDKGHFKVTDIDAPIGDGADYINGIRELFPSNIANKIIHDSGETALFVENQNQAEKYFDAEISEKGYLDVNIDNGKVTVVTP